MRQGIEGMMHRYKLLLQYPLHQWRSLIAIAALTVGTSATATLQPWPMKILVDYAFGQATIPLHHWFSNFNSLTPTVLVVVAAVCSFGLYILNASLDTSLN